MAQARTREISKTDWRERHRTNVSEERDEEKLRERQGGRTAGKAGKVGE